jgi:hypothetical protein
MVSMYVVVLNNNNTRYMEIDICFNITDDELYRPICTWRTNIYRIFISRDAH